MLGLKRTKKVDELLNRYSTSSGGQSFFICLRVSPHGEGEGSLPASCPAQLGPLRVKKLAVTYSRQSISPQLWVRRLANTSKEEQIMLARSERHAWHKPQSQRWEVREAEV